MFGSGAILALNIVTVYQQFLCINDRFAYMFRPPIREENSMKSAKPKTSYFVNVESLNVYAPRSRMKGFVGNSSTVIKEKRRVCFISSRIFTKCKVCSAGDDSDEVEPSWDVAVGPVTCCASTVSIHLQVTNQISNEP